MGLREFRIGTVDIEPSGILRDIVKLDDNRLALILSEYKSLSTELNKRYIEHGLNSYRNLGVGDSTSLLIYGITRLLRPNVVLETGVAMGHSTFFILNALTANSNGSLWSTEIYQNAGGLIHESEKARWHLEVLQPHHSEQSFESVVSRIDTGIDFFIHDSGNHSYPLQMFEYKTVYPKMSSDSILASDDVQSSYAFIDFARTNKEKPLFLLEIDESKRLGKIFGLLKISQ